MTQNRIDANEVAFLQQQLEFMRQKELEIEYAVPKAAQLVPFKTDIPAGASVFSYTEKDVRGKAGWLANGATDLPTAEVSKQKFSTSFERLGSKFEFTMDDLQAAQMAGMSIDASRRSACVRAVNEMIDDVITSGESTLGFVGLANHPSVQHQDAATPTTGSDKSWQGGDKTTMEILADMNALVNKIADQTADLHKANRLVLPSTLYRFIQDTPLDSSGTNSDSILTAFKKNHPEVTVMNWLRLEDADSAGTGPRAIAYELDSDNMEFLMNDPLSEMPPQLDAFTYAVRMTCKVGGLVVYRPYTIAYMDDL